MKKLIILSICLYMSAHTLQRNRPQQIIGLFVHGIADSDNQAKPFARTCTMPLESFKFDCSTEWFYRINVPYCSLGQENELEQLDVQWKKLNEKFPLADGFIFIGVSRGASAIINFLATRKPAKVKGVILDSPFDNIESCVQLRAERWGIPPSVIRTIISLGFWQFDPEGICPDKVIEQIKQDLPMLFVTVEDDHSVPADCSRKLLAARTKQGHAHGHHLHLMQGLHGKIIQGPDAQTYQQVAHAFFAHYGLPHNAQQAAEGQAKFACL